MSHTPRPATSGPPGADRPAPVRSTMQAGLRSTLIGAMFLMATSAIGPGFITQTTTFTVQLGAAFAFAIAVSIVVDIALQMNVWRIIGVTGYRAQELGNRVLPGLGFLMAFLLLVGGFVFNVGNVSGAGLGIQAMLGVDPKIGGAVSALIAIGLFLSKRAGVAIDRAVVVLGVVMITLTTFVAIVSGPPVGAVLRNVVLPEQVSALAITTLIGGTVGGYIVYAGAHRLLDSGVSGRNNVQTITQASIIGILITGLMRILLFLAILGVVTMGAQLDPESLAASAFQVAAGEVGLRVFGIVLWAAAITSVIGASYTTVTFITPRTAGGERLRPWLVAGFIVITSVIYLLLGTAPQTLLVFAGAFNGILLPVGIGVILFVGWFRGDLMGGYRYPKWLLVLGTLAWLATLYFAVNAISPAIELFTGG